MLKEMAVASVVIVVAVVFAAMVPVMQAVALYREWCWEGNARQ